MGLAWSKQGIYASSYMSFKVAIKNIGKLADAELRVGRFTVFAGPNNTGKSFVSKLLYSLFDAMNANPAETYINRLISPVEDAVLRMEPWIGKNPAGFAIQARLAGAIMAEGRRLNALVKEASIDQLDGMIPSLVSQTAKMQDMAADILTSSLKDVEKDFGDEQQSAREAMEKWKQRELENVISSLAKLKETLNQTDARNLIFAGIQEKIRQNLIQNFQVPSLSDLRNEETALSKVNVENFGSFEFSNGEIRFDTDISWIKQFQQYSSVIYLESPVYWKLRNVLEEIRRYPTFFTKSGREPLSGVPGYFYDLARALKFEYTGEIAFPDVYERLTCSDVIGGKIGISETGDLSFQENGRSFSLPVTAMGIANLGILALLIERKVLDKGSYLFIDEPEAHLHPAWQVIMAETLFELSRQGVNVVIATHSADILKWLEVHVKKNPDDEQLVALNQFPVNGREVDEDFETRMAEIKQELTKPFSDLYLEGL